MKTLNELAGQWHASEISPRMPVLFIGHGNPMNAVEQNEYNRKWASLSLDLPRPKAILVISAHWLTRGTLATAMERPRTIHDFHGFPEELYEQQYPAPGAPEWANLTRVMVKKAPVEMDFQWGLDHGTWSFLLPMYPEADIPVFQLSLDYNRPMTYHYELAKELMFLRERGVLIIGSGNIVHNLQQLNPNQKPYDWAIEFDLKMKEWIEKGDHSSILMYRNLGTIAEMAVPTHDHYLPLIYSLALTDPKNENLSFFNDKVEWGSISMRSFISQ